MNDTKNILLAWISSLSSFFAAIESRMLITVISAMFAIAAIGGSVWSNHKIAKLETAVEAEKQLADGRAQLAEKREFEAAEYKQKIAYLERQLTEIQVIARKQDEELEKLNANS